MKDKEKQIEEMAEDIRNELQYEIEDGSVDAYDTAFRLVRNKGWVKSNEDSVVLSKEEYEKITKELITEQRAKEIAQEYFGVVRKETAEKLIKFVSEHCDNETLIWQLDEFIKTI